MSKADNETLNALHGLLAAELMRKIRSGEATAAELNVARQMLKDNGIESRATPANPLGQLNSVVSGLPFPDIGLPN